jgi:hypothetical protein
MLGIVLTALVAIFGRIETRHVHRPETRPAWIPGLLHRLLTSPVPRLLLTVAGYVAVILGLLGNSLTSRTEHETLGIPPAALAAFLAGALTLRLLRSVLDQPATRHEPSQPTATDSRRFIGDQERGA